MTHADAFLQAIIAEPDDDTPRLIYADWLEENGDPERAEFIRVQIQLAALDEYDDRRPVLEARERELLAEHRERWLGSLAPLAADIRFRRGFPEQIAIGLRRFLDQGETLFASAPVLHVKLLRINQTHVTPAEIAACPLLARLTGLNLSNSDLGDAALSQILASPHLSNLHTLEIAGTQARVLSIRALQNGKFDRLRVLDLSNNFLGEAILPLLAGRPRFRLRSLNLSGAFMEAVVATRLAAWPGLDEVTHLDLSINPLRVSGGQALAASRHLQRLAHLQLRSCFIGAGGTEALAESPTLAGLQALGLDDNNIGKRGIQAIVHSNWPRLERLELGNGLTTAGMLSLAGWPGLARLKAFAVTNSPLQDEGVLHLTTAAGGLSELRELNLSACGISSRGAQALAECPTLTNLRSLSLFINSIGDAGARALLSSPHLERLQWLKLDFNSLSKTMERQIAKRFVQSKE